MENTSHNSSEDSKDMMKQMLKTREDLIDIQRWTIDHLKKENEKLNRQVKIERLFANLIFN
jgi:hypothetical protein